VGKRQVTRSEGQGVRGMEDGYEDGKGDGNREILGETGMGKVELG
jgi:hypothetical protein